MKRSSAISLFYVGIVLYCLVPFLWFVLTSLKTGAQLTAIPPTLIPSFHLGFYRSALQHYGLLHYVGNSAIVAGLTSLITVTVGSLAAYAIARFELKWTNFYLLLLLVVSRPDRIVRRSSIVILCLPGSRSFAMVGKYLTIGVSVPGRSRLSMAMPTSAEMMLLATDLTLAARVARAPL